jgi:O-antigen ligase
VTGGFKGMLEHLGGLDMNGIRLIGMTAALSLVVLAERKVGRQVFRPAAIFYALLVAYCAATLSLSPSPIDGARLLLKIAYPLLVFLVITGLSPDRERLDRLMDAVLIGTAILCVVINPLYVAFGDFERQIGGWLRLRGVGAHQNPFAFYLIVAMLISFVRFTTRRQARYLVLCAICAAWMVMTITRIAFLATLVALLAAGVVGAIATRQARMLIGATVVALLIAIPFAPPVLERSFGFMPTPVELVGLLTNPEALFMAMNWEGRMVFWAVVFQAFLTSPILGLGLGASTFVLRMNFPAFVNPVVHNDYLRLLSEAGLIGVVLFTAAMAAWLAVAFRAARLEDRTVREYALPAVGCLAALAIIGLTDNAFDYYGPFTQYTGYLCGGAAAAAACYLRARESDPDTSQDAALTASAPTGRRWQAS